MQINDGTGKGYAQKVNSNNQAYTFTVTEDEAQAANALGNAFNINTGAVALTGTSESALLYFKNDESAVSGESDYVITSIIIGIGTRSATVTDAAAITILRNPTAGTIVDNASAAAMKSNSNFGSSNELSDSLVYKGANGYTFTDGTDHALIYMTDGRMAAPVNIELPKGASVGVKIDLNTSGGANVYCALIGYRKDGNI